MRTQQESTRPTLVRRTGQLMLKPFTLFRQLWSPLEILRRIALPLSLLFTVFISGSAGYYVLGAIYEKHWSFIDCMYMTSITLTTVGFGDYLGAEAFEVGKIYNMILVIAGMSVTLYSTSSLTAFIVEGHLRSAVQENRMHRRIARLENHTIICGGGRTGIHIINEHVEMGMPFVVIDNNQAELEHHAAHYPDMLYICGDATDEEILEAAGVRRAKNLVAALSKDQDNLYLVVSARYVCPNVRIIAKCFDHAAAGKFIAAGANHVVSSTYIGGMRIASQVLRPNVVNFFDSISRSSGGSALVSEVTVHEGSEIEGKTIQEARIGERVNLVIVALKKPGASDFVYSPHKDTRLVKDMVLVTIGPIQRIQVLEQLAGHA